MTYEIAKKIVYAGNSKIFKNWHENTGISAEYFLEGIKWLCEEPVYAPAGKTDWMRLRRELGITKDGKLIRMERAYYDDGEFAGFYDVDSHYAGWRCGVVCSISAAERV